MDTFEISHKILNPYDVLELWRNISLSEPPPPPDLISIAKDL